MHDDYETRLSELRQDGSVAEDELFEGVRHGVLGRREGTAGEPRSGGQSRQPLMGDARDQAIEAGADLLAESDGYDRPDDVHLGEARAVFDAAHKAGLVTFSDEWEQVGWLSDHGTFWSMDAGHFYEDRPVFVRRSDTQEAEA